MGLHTVSEPNNFKTWAHVITNHFRRKGLKTWKEYMEKLMNEANEWDHRISAGVKEGPADLHYD